MSTVGVNPPKTPIAKGSKGLAVAAVPNVCKMPGPPAPFVPTPLPNIGKSNDRPKGYSKSVSIEKDPVAIKGATFRSKGDIASKGTGGGLISATTHGATAFVSPGAMDVSIEGKAVQLLGDAMTNNNGAAANASTPMEGQSPATPPPAYDLKIDCAEKKKSARPPWDDCMVAQVCAMVQATNDIPKGKLKKISPSPSKTKAYQDQLNNFKASFAQLVEALPPDSPKIKALFYDPPAPPAPSKGCVHEKWKKSGTGGRPSGRGTGKFNPDHSHPASLGGNLKALSGLIWVEARVNVTVGRAMSPFDPEKHSKVTASKCCS